MRVYPISYYNSTSDSGTTIIIFSYTENGSKVALKFKYKYWFYASLNGTSYEAVRDMLLSKSGVCIDEKSNIRELRSTIYLHEVYSAVKIFCVSERDKNEALNIFQSMKVDVHEMDSTLDPILKLMAEKKFEKYGWMDVEVERTTNPITKFEIEYDAKIDSIKKCTESIPPPTFSMFSFDLETYSCNTNKVPDPHRLANETKIACITFVSATQYQEIGIVYGPNTEWVHKKYRPLDYEFKMGNKETKIAIETVNSELALIQRLFEYINILDPDIISGHNILGFDTPYLSVRNRILIMNDMKSKKHKSIKLPNISRLREFSPGMKPVEWNNSQVAMKGSYIDTPGRIWIDMLVVASRGLLGGMKNNKLDTIARVHLGMSKNDIHHKDMFRFMRLHTDLKMSRDPKSGINPEDVIKSIDYEYSIAVKKHNKSLPRRVETKYITVHHLNELINLINMTNQRGTKLKTLTLRDGKDLGDKIFDKYNELRLIYRKQIKEWNIPLDKSLSPEEKVDVLWWLLVIYCFQDSRIPYQVLEQQSIIPVLREQSGIFSVDVNDVLMRGQVYTTNSAQYRHNHDKNFMMDFGPQGGPTGAYDYGGGYVGKGDPGLKIHDDNSLIFVVDFASLYPTIIIAYNLCYTTYVPPNMRDSKSKDYIWLKYEKHIYKRLAWLKEQKQDEKNKRMIEELEAIINAPYEKKGELMCSIHEIPNDNTNKLHVHWFLRESVLPGVVPCMLWEQYLARKAIKKKMDEAKAKKDWAMYITYNAQQLAVKVSMNATYGGFGTKTNRLANFPVAETVTFIGRTSIQKCNKEIESRFKETVVYNDTDSAMVRMDNLKERFNLDTKAIISYCHNVAGELTKMFPAPMSLECENWFKSFLLKAPKMYSAIKWDKHSFNIEDYTLDYVTTHGLLYVKGMASVRKDRYTFIKKLFDQILYGILARIDVYYLIKDMEEALGQIWKLKDGFKNISLVEEMFSYNMGVSPKAINGSNGPMGKWVGIYKQKYGDTPNAGERFDLLVTMSKDKYKHTKSADKLCTMEWMIQEGRKLDVEHYIEVFSKPGNVVELLHLAYPDSIDRDIVESYYLKSLRTYGTLHPPAKAA